MSTLDSKNYRLWTADLLTKRNLLALIREWGSKRLNYSIHTQRSCRDYLINLSRWGTVNNSIINPSTAREENLSPGKFIHGKKCRLVGRLTRHKIHSSETAFARGEFNSWWRINEEQILSWNLFDMNKRVIQQENETISRKYNRNRLWRCSRNAGTLKILWWSKPFYKTSQAKLSRFAMSTLDGAQTVES